VKINHRRSGWFVAVSIFWDLPAIPQSLAIEPPHSVVCWVTKIPDRWDFTAADLRLYGNVTNVEFRRNPIADGEMLVAVWLFGSPPAAHIYSKNAYWISTTGNRRPRLATANEWAAGERVGHYHTYASDCKTDANGATCGDRRFDRTHTLPLIGRIGVTASQSPDGRWLAVEGWDGQLQYQGNGGILGGFPDSGGIGGARGHQFVDLFDFKTAQRIATAGGNFDGREMGVFMHAVYWLAPHYLFAELNKSDRTLLFCNPALSERNQ
jgi:hypothetical protein